MAKTRDMNELRQVKEYQGTPTLGLTPNRRGYSEIDIDTTKELIISDLQDDLFDIMFEKVNNEMSKHEAFQPETYFTPQGEDVFEDEWFDFYHEHHGQILSSIMKKFK